MPRAPLVWEEIVAIVTQAIATLSAVLMVIALLRGSVDIAIYFAAIGLLVTFPFGVWLTGTAFRKSSSWLEAKAPSMSDEEIEFAIADIRKRFQVAKPKYEKLRRQVNSRRSSAT
jgi:hypothetical protein